MLDSDWFNADNTSLAKLAMKFPHKLLLELHDTIYECVEGGVPSNLYVAAGVELGAVLANDNFAFFDTLIAKNFNAKSLRY